LGRWAVQCDVDPEGTVAYVTSVRAAGGIFEVPGRSVSEDVPAVSEQFGVLAGVAVSKVFLADGAEYFVVCDAGGRELGSFDKRCHTEFERRASAEQLERWLSRLATPLFHGLLALLVEVTSELGDRLNEAKNRRDALQSPEDYLFFGLTEDATDQDLERAYRRMSARLHPDKGGDEAGFAAMRRRYERLKSLRAQRCPRSNGIGARGNGESGAGSISWDPEDRASMLQAHEDLRLQLVYLTDQLEAVEHDIEELQQRRTAVHCLADRSANEQEDHPAIEAAVVAHSGPPMAAPVFDNASVGYSEVGGVHARHDLGTCMVCLEPILADPRLVVNLCSAVPQCQCLVHLHCFLDPQHAMTDQFRRCMICKRPSDPELVRRAVQAREGGLL